MTPDDRGFTTEFEEEARDKAVATLPPEVVEYIEECNARPHASSYLIPVLHKVQEECGYLSEEAMDAVSVLMQIPATRVTGVASFYHFFNFSPPGQHRISLCMGTACFVKGAGAVLDTLTELLGVGLGETTEDRRFSLDAARCVGACALAPVMLVDERVYSEVTPDMVGKILADHGYEGKSTNT
jgi:NADH:ubiquinone oxidoreductase subunit E